LRLSREDFVSSYRNTHKNYSHTPEIIPSPLGTP
jgi:hypothetical protein